ncbi:MAG: hypothetical protein AB7I41_23170 [Candidatus Sericytochromatia bacterium]
MRIEQNQFAIQDRSQVSSGSTKPEASSPSTQPAHAKAFTGNQNQILNKAESNQGSSNKGTSLLSRLASLAGVNPIPVIPIKETEFFIDSQKNDSNNHHDRFVHISGEAIDTDGERDDLQNAVKQSEKEGFPVIFIQGDEGKPQYFKASSRELGGEKPAYISKVQSLAKGSTETFALDNLEANVKPLERLNTSTLNVLQNLDAQQHGQLEAIGSQGTAFLKVAKNDELLTIAKRLNPQQIQILSQLSVSQLDAFRQIPAPSRAFIDIPRNSDNSPAISNDDFKIMNMIPPDILPKMQDLSLKELGALQSLKGLPFEVLDILTWPPEQLNAFQQLDPEQLTELQTSEPEQLKSMRSLGEQLRLE